jgi:hypothetical protein
MAAVKVITDFLCPGCAEHLIPNSSGAVICSYCAWKGEAYLFSPRVLAATSADIALPDEATCLHHPRKKATAICAGTGDYICSLCAVEINGQTFGAEYLNSAGKDKAGKAFDRTLERPDSRIVLYLLLLFIPYINFVVIPLAFVWLPHAFYLYFKALRLRRENPLYRRLIGTPRVVTLAILLFLVTLGWVAGVAALVIYFLSRRR